MASKAGWGLTRSCGMDEEVGDRHHDRFRRDAGVCQATSLANLITGTVILRALRWRFTFPRSATIDCPMSALTTFSPHCEQTTAGIRSMTTSLPLIQKACLTYFSSIRSPQTWHSPELSIIWMPELASM